MYTVFNQYNVSAAFLLVFLFLLQFSRVQLLAAVHISCLRLSMAPVFVIQFPTVTGHFDIEPISCPSVAFTFKQILVTC
jgi:hypothetical protein